MEYQRLALILDDEASQIGELALQLVRLGGDGCHVGDGPRSALFRFLAKQLQRFRL